MKYNIIFLMTDQHRTDHVSFLPGSRIHTPNIDRIAESVAFSNCISVNPICTPARTALLTGKYTHQIGTLAMSGDLSLEHPTYLQALQGAGYWTAAVGKLHWLQGWPWNTERGKGYDVLALKKDIMKYGLDYLWESSGKQLALKNHCDYCEHLHRIGILDAYRDHIEGRGGNSMDPDSTKWTGEPWPFAEEDYIDIVTGREIIKVIEKRPKDRPFFLFGSFCGPHKPYDPPKSYLDMVPVDETEDFLPGDDEPSIREATKMRLFGVRRAYKAMIHVIDTQIGDVFDKLESEGLLDSTVVLFSSDHGEMLGDRNRMSKMQPWKQSVAVPTAIRHPAYLSNTHCDSPVENIDLTATILEAAELQATDALSKPWPAFHDRVPCRSLMPIVRGEKRSIRDMAFSECRGEWQMLQSDRWKYIRYLHMAPENEPKERLYNLESDPGELVNVIKDPACAEVLGEFRERCTRLIDATPPGQTRWAPYLSEEKNR